jgi:hypothetical protein
MPRPPILDEVKRAEICALLAAGCSQQAAARYVGVSPTAIRNAARREPAFHQQLLKAMQTAELDSLQNIRAAAAKSWRAAAWLLERTKPQQYGYRSARHLSTDYWQRMWDELIGLVHDLLPDAKTRDELCRRIDRVMAKAQLDAALPWPFGPGTPAHVPSEDPDATSPRFLDE